MRPLWALLRRAVTRCEAPGERYGTGVGSLARTHDPAPPLGRIAPRRPADAAPGARVTCDPVVIARLRHRLALDALLAIRPWQREERSACRQVLDLAARELNALMAARQGRCVVPPPLPPGRSTAERATPRRGDHRAVLGRMRAAGAHAQVV